MDKSTQAIKPMLQTLKQLKTELSALPFELAGQKVKDVHKPRKVRKSIARILTKIHQISYSNVKNATG